MYVCPKCKSSEKLSVTVITSARLIQHDDGAFETEVDGDEEWDGTSSMWCECGFSAAVVSFDTEE